ncbi:S24 family peptidase [Brevundimonas naejangsanensis]|uniref:S24 family peptidase n=1 Tax=Brevundimonas naejangsanensis TaxID=588932 RepID=UPI0026E9C98F|nr:S24 family peptidase [Brevundimonas naejangsanensis]
MGLSVNIGAPEGRGWFVLMDDPRTWTELAARPEMQERGAKNRLARRLGMDPSYLGRKLTQAKSFTLVEADAVRGFLDGDAAPEAAPPSGRRVPIYGYAAMGSAGVGDSGETIAMGTGDVIDWTELPAGLNPRGDCFIIHPIGSSMEPRIFEGEPLLVLVQQPPLRNGDALIEFNDGTGVVKSYLGTRQGRVWARQYNPDEGRDYAAETVKAVHRVIRL